MTSPETASSQNSSETSEDRPLTPQEYRDLVLRVTSEAMGILNLESQTLQLSGADPLVVNSFDTAFLVLAMLQGKARTWEPEPDLLLPNIGLVDAEGRPLTNPSSQNLS